MNNCEVCDDDGLNCNVCGFDPDNKSSASPACSTPTEEQVLKAVYESGLHQYAPDVLKTRWKDGIDIETPSAALMNFARKLLA